MWLHVMQMQTSLRYIIICTSVQEGNELFFERSSSHFCSFFVTQSSWSRFSTMRATASDGRRSPIYCRFAFYNTKPCHLARIHPQWHKRRPPVRTKPVGRRTKPIRSYKVDRSMNAANNRTSHTSNCCAFTCSQNSRWSHIYRDSE